MHAIRSRVSPRKQQVWVYTIAGLFVCDFILCGYLPAQQRLRSLEQAQAQQKRVMTMAAAQEAQLAGLEQRLGEMEKKVEQFDLRVPAERALGAFLQQVADTMTGLGDQVVLPGQEVQASGLTCVPIQVACRGALPDIFRFLTRLQSLERLVRIQKVALENDAELTGRLRLQLEAVIFEQAAAVRPTGSPAAARAAQEVSHGV
jgi:Tfp pilus assembly protein PilO